MFAGAKNEARAHVKSYIAKTGALRYAASRLPPQKLLDLLESAICQVHISMGGIDISGADVIERLLHQIVHAVLRFHHVGTKAEPAHLTLQTLETTLGRVSANRKLIVLLASLTHTGFRLGLRLCGFVLRLGR